MNTTTKILLAVVLFAYCQLPTADCSAQSNESGSGNALEFDGVDDYVSFGDVLSFERTDPFTLSAWINWDGTFGGQIINKQVQSGNFTGYDLYIDGTDKITLRLRADNSSVNLIEVEMSQILPTNEWLYITATYDGSSTAQGVNLYLNGVLDPSSIITNNLTSSILNNAPLTMGAYPDESNFFGSYIDEVRIWNRALTQTEIRQNMTQKLIGNEAGLVGYWRFDEGAGTTASDSSPNANNGTLQ